MSALASFCSRSAAAHHDQVDAGKVDGVAVVHAADLHGDAAPCQALLQHAHVAAVAVQVQQVGEQVRDDHGVLPVRHIFAGRRAVGTLGSEIARRGRLSRGGSTSPPAATATSSAALHPGSDV